MTDKQALDEARKRWGKNASIRKTRHASIRPETKKVLCGTHRVGIIVGRLFFNVLGDGMSWREAFSNYDKEVK